MAEESSTAREVLEQSTFFGALPPPAREEVIARLRRVELPAGTVVVREGEIGGGYYLIVSGEAEVWSEKRTGPTGTPDSDREAWLPGSMRQTLVARLGPGEGFGEMALLLGGPRRATVRAATDLVLYNLAEDSFGQVLDQYRGPAVALEEELTLRASVTELGRTSPFAKLPPEALGWLAARLHSLRFGAGEDIIREGDQGDALYLVRTGNVTVLGQGPDRTEHELASLGPGDLFGEQALVSGEPRSATVRAQEPVEVLRLDQEDFQAVARKHWEYGDYFLQLALQRQRPQRIEVWALEQQSGRHGETVYILKDTRGHRYLKLSEEGAFLWGLLDGRRTVRDLTMAYFARYRVFGLDAIVAALLQLKAAGFVQIQALDALYPAPGERKSLPQRAAAALLPWLIHYFSLPDIDRLASFLYRLTCPLFWRPITWLLFVATLAGAGLFARYLLLGGAGLHSATQAGGWAVAIVIGSFLQDLLHELGHALTTKHFGRSVHRAGAGWYFFFPVFFVDTSDMWMSGRWPRAVVAFAGPYVNFMLAGLATLLMLLARDPRLHALLFQFALTGFGVGLLNLNPLLEWDGYYVLMDWLEVPNLRAKALAFVGSLLWRTERTTRDKRLVRIFSAYGVLTLFYTIFVAVTVLTAYHHYLLGAVREVLPPLVAGLLGWLIAGVMSWLILARAWSDLRAGVRPARVRGPIGA